MLFLVETKLIVKRLVLCQAFADTSNFDAQVKVFELKRVEVKLPLLSFDSFFCDSFAKELTRVQELFQQEPGELSKNLDSFSINLGKVVLSHLLLLFIFLFWPVLGFCGLRFYCFLFTRFFLFFLISFLSGIFSGLADALLSVRHVVIVFVLIRAVHHAEILHNHDELVKDDRVVQFRLSKHTH